MLNNTYRNYTPEEILQIFKEEHRIFSFLDSGVDREAEIEREISIYDWRCALDLLPWHKLYKFMNERFNIDISANQWLQIVSPEKKKTIWDMCIFISQFAKKEIIHPINIFGKKCLGASVFLTLKQNFEKRGIDVKNLRPSALLSDYFNRKNFPWMIEEIIKTGVKTFDSLKTRLKDNVPFWQKINIFNPYQYELDDGSIKTFRDLSLKIAEQLPLH